MTRNLRFPDWTTAATPGRVFILLCVIGLVVLAPILGTGLLCDDYQYWLRWQSDSLSAADIFAIQGGKNRPLTTALLVFTTGIFESSPWALGLIRVAHHAANALLVGLILRRTWADKPITALLASTAFLVWGSHAEIFWQSSLHDVLAASFVLLAVYLATFEFSWRPAVGMAAAAFAGYWSKESAWCLPLLCVVITVPGSSLARRFWGAAVAAFAFVPYMLLRYAWLDGLWGHVVPTSVSTSFDLSVVFKSVTNLVFRSFVPGWIKTGNLVPVAIAVTVVIATAAVGIAIASIAIPKTRAAVWGRRADPLLLACLSFGFSLIPVAKLSVSLQNTENARYVYLPTAFAVIVVILLWQRLARLYPRAANTTFFLLILFQAGSLHALGWNWVQATQTMNKYRAALEQVATDNPEVEQWLIACAPDNHRGAFSARNTTPNILAAMDPYRSRWATVLATKYVRKRSESTGCDYSVDQDERVLTLRTNRYALSHPAFYDRENPIKESRWMISAEELRGFRAKELSIRFDKLNVNERIAIFDGQKLHVVPKFAPIR